MWITCNGCFDGLHPGHLFLLGFVRGQCLSGDEVMVMINSDAYIRANKRVPNYTEEERSEMLIGTGVVREVRVFRDGTAAEMVREIKPRVHCIGVEYSSGCPEIDVCRELDIRVAFIPECGLWRTANLNGKTVYDMRMS